MNELNQTMLTIKSIDPSAHVEFSEYTLKWFVSSRIHVGDGAMLTGITEHHDRPDAAVMMFFGRLKTIDAEEYLAVGDGDRRRNYRWNGAAFAEVPVPRMP